MDFVFAGVASSFIWRISSSVTVAKRAAILKISSGDEYPRIYRVWWTNQSARKLLSTCLVNTKSIHPYLAGTLFLSQTGGIMMLTMTMIIVIVIVLGFVYRNSLKLACALQFPWKPIKGYKSRVYWNLSPVILPSLKFCFSHHYSVSPWTQPT